MPQYRVLMESASGKSPRVGLAMIVRDVAPFIKECLDSIVPYVDEAVIVDTGSIDDTKSVVARCLNAHQEQHPLVFSVLDFNITTHPDVFRLDTAENGAALGLPGPFSGKPLLIDFSAARQYAFDHVKLSDYVLWLDADDVVVGAEKLRDLAKTLYENDVWGALMPYEYAVNDRGIVTCVLKRERLLRAGNVKWHQRIHEFATPAIDSEKTIRGAYSEVTIRHRRDTLKPKGGVPHRNIKVLHYQLEDERRKDPTFKDTDPRIFFYLGMECRFHNPEVAKQYLENYLNRARWQEERSLAFQWLGELAENAHDYTAAFAWFSAACLEFTKSPDGYFGCARIACYRQEWEKCIELTERGFAITNAEQEQVLQYDPYARQYQPLRHVMLAYLKVNRVEEGLEAARRALALNPEDDDAKTNIEICEHLLASKKEGGKGTTVGVPIEFAVDGDPRDLPLFAESFFAIHLWQLLMKEGNTAKAVAFLNSLPSSLEKHSKIIEALKLCLATAKTVGDPLVRFATMTVQSSSVHTLPSPKINAGNGLKIIIWTGGAIEKWSHESIETGGIGGSETAAIMMARGLVKEGHEVCVYGDFSETSDLIVADGVTYMQHHLWSDPSEIDCDVLIASRQAWILEHPCRAKLRVLWVHDIHVGLNNEALMKQIACADVILCLTKWHKQMLESVYPGLDTRKVLVTRNGIVVDRYVGRDTPKKNHLIYSSSGNRGLAEALDIFADVRAEVPNAELHVYYGFNAWRAFASRYNAAELQVINDLERRLVNTPGVVAHGRVGQDVLAQAQLEAKIWFYPTAFTETFCVSALEAQAAGCVPVTTELAGLTETVKSGFLIAGQNSDPSYRETFARKTIELLKNDALLTQMQADAISWARNPHHDWGTIATEWSGMFKQLIAHPGSTYELQGLPPPKESSRVLRVDPTSFSPRMRLAFIYGSFSSGIHGKFHIPGLWTEVGLTGSESSFFNMVKALSELGHQVDVFCDVTARYQSPELGGAHVYPLWMRIEGNYDAYVSWNEPNLLSKCPPGVPRICFQQLNDFSSYTDPGWDKHVDIYVMPSETHRKYLCNVEPISPEKTMVLPNSINIEFYEKAVKRNEKAIVWCSSPDRGLHVMLPIFERVRSQEKDAVLKIFYRFAPWYEKVKDEKDEAGARARVCQSFFDRLGRYGENGIILFDSVPNKRIAEELLSSGIYAYPCEPIRFTEGFSVSTLDACAAGANAIISDVDALGEIYGNYAHVVPGRPSERMDDWTRDLVAMLRGGLGADRREEIRRFARQFDRKKIARRFEKILRHAIDDKRAERERFLTNGAGQARQTPVVGTFGFPVGAATL